MMKFLLAASHADPVAAPVVVDWSQFNDSVLIQVERAPGNKIGNTVCTGVILHPQVVLTTAHCAQESKSMTVVFDVENGNEAKKKEKVLPSRIVMNPDYQPKKSLYKNDLAILFLKTPAPISAGMIRKIPNVNPLKSGDRLTRLGVGLRNGKNLRNTTNPIYVGNPMNGVMETSDIFSYFGDSGGPLYSEQHELLAIHSTIDDFGGKKTPHAYGVYLADHLKWIQKMIKKYL